MKSTAPSRGALAAAALLCMAAASSAEEIVALTSTGRIVTFDSAAPGVLTGDVALTGLGSDLALSIDLRPADDRAYVVTSLGRLYRVDRATGAATAVGSVPFTPRLSSPAGIDFDPAADVLRVVDTEDRNFRISPNSGQMLDGRTATFGPDEDFPLEYAAGDVSFGIDPTVSAIAYDRNRRSSTDSRLFGIDVVRSALVRIDPANDGVLRTVGPLGVATGFVGGFDVSGATGIAYAVLTARNGGGQTLYGVNLETGAATPLGAVAAPATIVGMTAGSRALPPGAAPLRVALVGLTSAGELIRFMSDAPGTVTRRVTLTGLLPGDDLVAIASRPTNGRLYGLSRTGRLYVLNATTGVATPIREAPFDLPLAGTRFGLDFQPASGRARVVSDSGQSFRVDPDTGRVLDGDASLPGIQPDAPLEFAAFDVNADGLPTVFGVAFADDAFTHAPTLFGIDPELELLVGVGSAGGAPESPSTGTVRTIGRLDLDAASFGGFEIVPAGGPAFAAFGTTRGTTRLFAIDLTTGTPAVLGNIGVAEDVIGLAVAPTSNPRAPGDDLGIRRLDIRLDFAHGGRDSFAAEGTLPLQAGELAGRVVTVDVGGFSKTFTFGRGGRAAKDDETTRSRLDDDRFTFAERASDGRIGFTAIVRREDVAASLADEGLDGGRDVRREPRTVGVSVTIDGVTYTTSVVLRYTAAAGRSGTASRAGDVRRPLSPR